MYILGLESSCDETAAAIVEDGARVLSSVVASQMDTHRPFGGVVPELASREHLRNIVPVVREAFRKSGLKYADAAAVGVTAGPGLAGALLVGVAYAKAMTLSLGVPLIGVNHLEGHIHAVLLEHQVEFPTLVLLVSGGHTLLVRAEREGPGIRCQVVGRTRDDAAGEAFDKVAKMLALGFPGGPVIDKLARHGNPNAVAFTTPKIKGAPLDFSFSGIKTAVLRRVQSGDLEAEAQRRSAALRETPSPSVDELLKLTSRETLDLIASFQNAVVEDLWARTHAAAESLDVQSLMVTGGVACNSLLRQRFSMQGGLPVSFPSPSLSTDNAAMIAAAAYPKMATGTYASLTLAPNPQLSL